ncbi:MAG: hypothetical protein IPK17_05385 [Chloroflexi bacterium]|uniref:hypothetical protein n=1 Tax=Candidatus Flexifilum breve TaxID=3140694 RepID=UPI0031360673|nr:hypothetical protein [Chloroflexota bacterium]
MSGISLVRLKLVDENSQQPYKAVREPIPHAIIVTQDCDLEQDYDARFNSTAGKHRKLPNILFCEVEIADDVQAEKNSKEVIEEKRVRSEKLDSGIWEAIPQNKDERFQFFARYSSK